MSCHRAIAAHLTVGYGGVGIYTGARTGSTSPLDKAVAFVSLGYKVNRRTTLRSAIAKGSLPRGGDRPAIGAANGEVKADHTTPCHPTN